MIESALGLQFRLLTREHQGELSAFLRARPQPLSGYTFAALCAWRGVFDYRWAFCERETLLVSCRLASDGPRRLLQPIGALGRKASERLVEAARQLATGLEIIGVDRTFLERNPFLVAACQVHDDRGNANYVYRAADLARLAGRKYAKKRNLVAQAGRAYAWASEELSVANVAAALEVVERVGAEAPTDAAASLADETAALVIALEELQPLGQGGLLMRVGDRPVGFSIFEAQSADTAVVHFERALRAYKGLHQVLHQRTAQVIVERGFSYINREEDMGDPGLRQAKLSYHPARIVDAFRLVLPR